MHLYLIRGIPGAGKTTLAKALVRGHHSAVCVAADDYFEGTGTYLFDPKKLGEAHSWCQDVVGRAMQLKTDLIVVHNTFVKIKDMSPYLFQARSCGYTHSIITVESPCFGSVHNVPEDTIARMRDTFQHTNPRSTP